MRFVLAFLFFTGVYFQGFCQKYSFVSYSTNEGLPQSQVTSVVQDANGYLWVGTLGGLGKFNGKDFVVYSSQSGLLNNRIRSLTIIDGDIWIGHEGGVTKYNRKSFQKFAFTGEEKSSQVKSIVKYRGKIFVSSNGGGLYTIENNKLKQHRLINQQTNSDYTLIKEMLVYNNELYMTTSNGVIRTRDLNKINVIDSLYDYSSTSIKVWGNELIISTNYDGLFTYDPIKQKTKKLVVKEELFNLKTDPLKFKSVFVDAKQNCWVSTNYGIIKINNNRKIKVINELTGLPIQDINLVYEDVKNNIWIGSMGKGLLRFPGDRFVYYNQSSGLISDLILNINQDENGMLWFGTYDKGLMTMTERGKISSTELTNSMVWTSVFNVNGYNWFGTNDGLVRMSSSGEFTMLGVKDGIPDQASINAFYKINSNSMYVGGDNGVLLYKNGIFKLLPASVKKDIGTVRDFILFNKDLYCGTSKGLFVYKNDKFIQINKIKNAVSCIEKDNNNNIWIGTEEGLFVYTIPQLISSKKAHQIYISDIPSSNLVTFLVFRNNRMYVGTNNGLVVISDYVNSKKYKIKDFGIREGVVDLETNLNSGFFDNRGKFWFGTSVGLVRYDESIDYDDLVRPKIHLKSILLNRELFDYDKYSDHLDENGFPASLLLPYSKNNIEFEMDGVSLTNHPDLKYQFWLEGLDETWSPKSKNTIISFTGLNADSYILHVRSVDDNGLISEEVVFPFEIKPAFYKSWWFIVLMISVISFIVFQLFRFKLKREREKSHSEMIEYKSKLMELEQKSLNASMNRHFIFNSLNSIQYFINSQDRLSANRYLTNFAKLIRKNLDSTNEEGNLISLTQELEGLELYLSLEAMRFKDKFEYKIDCKDVDTDSIIIPAMLLQPFIENCIIHGILPDEEKKGMISIVIKEEEENILTIQIDDNGVGIKNSILKKSENNGDHRSQGMEITTKRIDLIKKISNKGFELIGPFQIDETDSSINGTRVLLKIPFENLED